MVFLKVVEILRSLMEEISDKGEKMNIKFNKALFMLDKGKYEEGLELLEKAFEEEENIYTRLEIKSCMMEVFYEIGEIEKASKCMDFIFQHTSEEDDSRAREIAIKIREEIKDK